MFRFSTKSVHAPAVYFFAHLVMLCMQVSRANVEGKISVGCVLVVANAILVLAAKMSSIYKSVLFTALAIKVLYFYFYSKSN